MMGFLNKFVSSFSSTVILLFIDFCSLRLMLSLNSFNLSVTLLDNNMIDYFQNIGLFSNSLQALDSNRGKERSIFSVCL